MASTSTSNGEELDDEDTQQERSTSFRAETSEGVSKSSESSSLGVTEDGPQMPKRARVEPRRYSSSDSGKQVDFAAKERPNQVLQREKSHKFCANCASKREP